MSTCPTCGRPTDPAERGNAGERTITLEVPEHEWPLWRLTLSQMNTKFGVIGQGSLANMLNPWLTRFHDDFEMMRYFDDARMVLAYQVIGNGWPCEVEITRTERTNAYDQELSRVVLKFELEEGPHDFQVSDCAPHAIADRFKDYLEDYIARTRPIDDLDCEKELSHD